MSHGRWLAFAIGLVFLGLIGGTRWQEAAAQGDGQGFGQRYQISTFGEDNRRCYMVDTVTGELWELHGDGVKLYWGRVAEAPAR